jgi:hypothetical protein
LRETPLEPLTLRDIAVTGLGFFEERAAGAGPAGFASQITRGRLTLTDTGQQIVLAPEAALRLGDTQGRVASLRIGRDGIGVVFEGTVAEVTLGSAEFTRDLKPSLLEWAYHQQRLGFLWGALTFLWTLGWSVRRLLVGGT